MVYDVYELYVLGARLPNERVIERGKVRGEIVFERVQHFRYMTAMLLAADGSAIRDPILGARRYERQDGLVKFTGLQFYGSRSPKSKRWGRCWQEWLCRPVEAQEHTDTPSPE